MRSSRARWAKSSAFHASNLRSSGGHPRPAARPVDFSATPGRIPPCLHTQAAGNIVVASTFDRLNVAQARIREEGTMAQSTTSELVRNITKPVTLTVDFDGATRDPWGNERLGFAASTELDREEWGLTWNQPLETGGFLVGKKVRIELGVEAIRSSAEGAA